ncbi:SMP-30/gluconolactonase/LRE family protein [Alisedimentitalea sp. MJ-SS2]|uniref:SMP-30/gluconolactonase/LRE family protein n=1 Tax=Aliisedimentitalea sp. MJ-SS2 TaxID=3049795 RepID=UPI00290D463E|nr:SMP-30/gluconolactonase/LRE family protein [Alisedimentitalea sp. MJ-SS2]MDU8928795.1 SMP-30/gluconolactonase/LRE family protein [Alisedimentitalea sp. MJ-SS2]
MACLSNWVTDRLGQDMGGAAMLQAFLKLLAVSVGVGLAYILIWPVPIDPVAWEAPENKGYSGDFSPNERLAGVRRIGLGAHVGPEDITFGPEGRLYIPTHDGAILRYDAVSGAVEEFAHTGGRPLGVEFDRDGTLFVADAYRGLLKVELSGEVTVLADTTVDGSSIDYADDVDIGADGMVYFSDASVKFGAKANGGTLPASLLDLMEHGPNGRVLKYDPASGETSVLLDGLSFANGIALTADGAHLLVVETGTYSVLKLPVAGGEPTRIVENLPGFPDNINRNPDGTFWVGLVSPRSEAADALSGKPFLRKVVQRLPASIRPKPQRYGFVLRIDETGKVLETMQDPSGDYALTTGMIEAEDGRRYVSSLTEPDLGVLAAD